MPLPLRTLLALLLLLPLAAPGAAAGDDDGVLLRLNLQTDGTYRIAIVMDQEITQPPGGPMNTLRQRMGMGMLLKVGEVAEERIESTVSYEWVELRQHGMGLATEYDSRRTPGMPSDPAAMGYAVLVGKSFEMTMSPDGDVTGVSGVNAMVDEILRDLAVPPMFVEQVRADLRESFSDEAFRQQFAVTTFPQERVRVGETWEQEQRAGGQHPMIMSSRFTLDAVENGKARISLVSKLSSPDDVDETAETRELDGEQTGWMVVDLETGWVEQARMRQTIKAMVLVAPGQRSPMEMKSEVRIWGTDAEPQWEEEQ